MAESVSRAKIIAIMRRLGMSDSIDDAEQILPPTIHLERDAALLEQLGLDLDTVVDRLGGSPW